MRRTFGGLFDAAAKHGKIRMTNTPGNWKAAEKFEARQRALATNGKWRKSPARWKQNDGPFIDPEYYIVDWGQDG